MGMNRFPFTGFGKDQPAVSMHSCLLSLLPAHQVSGTPLGRQGTVHHSPGGTGLIAGPGNLSRHLNPDDSYSPVFFF